MLEQYKSAGQYDPELEQAIAQGDTNLSGITADPRYREASENALNELAGIGNAGGMRLSDKAMIGEIMSDVDARNRGAQQAIKSDVIARGGGGSGFELASRLGAAQGSAQDANRRGLDVAAMAEDRALQAILQGGEMGMKLEGMDYGQKAAEAQAQDAIDRWNAMNRADTQSRNVASTNAGRQYNLANDQRLMDANTDTRNSEQQHNKGLYQTYFGNQLDLANSKANARNQQANQLGQSADRNAKMWAGIGQGVGDIAAYLDGSKKDEETKWAGTDDNYLNKKYTSYV